MIPKKMHFIWFGPKRFVLSEQQFYSSWMEFAGDFEVKVWHLDDFPRTILQSRLFSIAIAQKQWAFATDIARLWILKNVGGVYIEPDTELVAPLETIITTDLVFGYENDYRLSAGIIASSRGNKYISRLLQMYLENNNLSDHRFLSTPNTVWITEFFKDQDFKVNGKKEVSDEVTLLPKEVLSPVDFVTKKETMTKFTVAVQHFDGSWKQESKKFYVRVLLKSILNQKYYLLMNLLHGRKKEYYRYFKGE